VDSKQLIQTVRGYDKFQAQQTKAAAKVDIIDHLAALGMKTPVDSSFCNPAQSTPKPTSRNAFCRCKSAKKKSTSKITKMPKLKSQLSPHSFRSEYWYTRLQSR
jgi:hypothetical protein